MRSTSDLELSSYEEVAEQQLWKYSMIEKYHFILKNDVLDTIPRTERKSIVTSKWIYKIKHSTNGNVDKYKSRFVS